MQELTTIQVWTGFAVRLHISLSCRTQGASDNLSVCLVILSIFKVNVMGQ